MTNKSVLASRYHYVLRPRASPACLLVTITYKRLNAFGRQGPTQSIHYANRILRRTVSTVRTEEQSDDRRTQFGP